MRILPVAVTFNAPREPSTERITSPGRTAEEAVVNDESPVPKVLVVRVVPVPATIAGAAPKIATDSSDVIEPFVDVRFTAPQVGTSMFPWR